MRHHIAELLIKKHGGFVLPIGNAPEYTMEVGKVFVRWVDSPKGNVTQFRWKYYADRFQPGLWYGASSLLRGYPARPSLLLAVKHLVAKARETYSITPDFHVTIGPDVNRPDCEYSVRLYKRGIGGPPIVIQTDMTTEFARQVCWGEMPKEVLIDWLKDMGHIAQ